MDSPTPFNLHSDSSHSTHNGKCVPVTCYCNISFSGLFLKWRLSVVEVVFKIKCGIFASFHFYVFPRDSVEPVVSRLCENGDRGPCTARPLRRSDGTPLRLGAREQRSRRRGGELQAQTSWVGDGPHQHSRLPEVWKEGGVRGSVRELIRAVWLLLMTWRRWREGGLM